MRLVVVFTTVAGIKVVRDFDSVDDARRRMLSVVFTTAGDTAEARNLFREVEALRFAIESFPTAS